MRFFFFLLFLSFLSFSSHQGTWSDFSIICLGENGGLEQASLTSFLIKARWGFFSEEKDGFLGLDMGTSLQGLIVASKKGSFSGLFNEQKQIQSGLTTPGYIFKDEIKGYLVTHPHFDHTSGIILSSTDDLSVKNLFGSPFTVDTIQQNVFNWETWPNFGMEGSGPLGTYNLVSVSEDGKTSYDVPGTGLSFTAFELVHGTTPSGLYYSTAFLVSRKKPNRRESRILFFGDTGPDSVQGVNNLLHIWQSVAPYVVDGSLLAIFLECSYTDSQPDNSLFGHLTPQHFMAEMNTLAEQVQVLSPSNYLQLMRQLKIVVIHIKPASILQQSSYPTWKMVLGELEGYNYHLRLDFQVMHQGDRLDL